MGMPGPAGPAGPVAAPAVVVTNLTGVQVTDPANGGALVMGPGLIAVRITVNGNVRVVVQAGPADIPHGPPVVGQQYDIASNQGPHPGLTYRSTQRGMYVFR